MGCDAFADERGEFKMEFRDHETGEVLQVVEFWFPDAEHKISWEILKGEPR